MIIKMKVSVVIAAYNSAGYLPQCLESLIGQTYGNLEIICVNDGSTDHTLSVMEEYALRDGRIRVFSKENEGKGAASARNLGLEQARGEYVLILDSDDFFEKDLVESCVEKAVKTRADIVIYGADMYDEALGKIVRAYPSIDLDAAPERDYFSYKDCSERICQIGNLVAWNKMFRRELIEKDHLRFDPIPISDDQFVPVIGMVEAERITVIRRPLLHYRFHTGHSQVDSQSKHPEAAYAANYTIVAKLKSLGVWEEVKRSYLNMSVRLMREYFDHMKTFETVSLLYHKFRKEIFPLLGADSLPEDYFYDGKLGEWYRMIRDHSLEEILFAAASGYGAERTTGILRFRVPYEKIPKGGRIALVGKDLTGRYWYAQILLAEYCEVVAWVDHEDEIPEQTVYDTVLYTSGIGWQR